MTSRTTEQQARALLTAGAVRGAAQRMLRLALDEALEHWRVDADRLPAVADLVESVTRERFPQLAVPMHSRWRHFVFGGHDLWREIAAQRWPDDPAARARAEFDLAITSVLLDAGAGPGWKYRDALTGIEAARSEGLALASLRWFQSGALSADAADPLRADATALRRVDAAAMNGAFQVSAANPLLGATQRAALLNRLGAAVEARPELFALAGAPRVGGLFDALARRAAAAPLSAATILEILLDALGPIWTGRPVLAGVALGDCWPHPAFGDASRPEGYVPLHKLSQWLAYSLLEPLQRAGIQVRDVGALTGLPEYRNGGLLVDMAVLIPRDGTSLQRAHAVAGPFVVEWRALTVALLDQLVPQVAQRLRLAADSLTTARVLEGGTWAAGRRIARERRADGGPPFQILSDGTVL